MYVQLRLSFKFLMPLQFNSASSDFFSDGGKVKTMIDFFSKVVEGVNSIRYGESWPRAGLTARTSALVSYAASVFLMVTPSLCDEIRYLISLDLS